MVFNFCRNEEIPELLTRSEEEAKHMLTRKAAILIEKQVKLLIINFIARAPRH